MFAWCLTGKTLRSIKIYGLLIEDTTDFVLSSSEHSKYKQVYLSRLGGKLSLPSPETFNKQSELHLFYNSRCLLSVWNGVFSV